MAVRLMLVAGRYRLLEPVGTGGMGRVWAARDEMLDREVAVKEFVPPDWLTDEEKDKLRDRTLREARSAARLNHPHVVRIYDVVHAEGLPWIVMEYVPSRSLHQVVAEDGPLSPEATARIGLHVLDALTAAHRAGVLHRDVKPHNVLIGPDGRVVLTDFGLATFVDDGSVTGPGLVVGSPQYVSPERARDGASTVESDLWSLGATLFAAVEGRSPYARDSAMATLMALATEPPNPAVLAGPLAPVLSGLLQHDPVDRLTAQQVEEQLRAIVRGKPGQAVANRRPVPAQRLPAKQLPANQPPLPVSAPPVGPPPSALPSGPYSGRSSAPPAGSPSAWPAGSPSASPAGPSSGSPAGPPSGSPAGPSSASPASPPSGSPAGPSSAASAGAEPSSPWRSRLTPVLVVVLLLAVLAGGATYLRQRGDDKPQSSGPAASSGPASSGMAAAAGVGGFSPIVCDRQPGTDAQRTPQPGAERTTGEWTLLSGFSYYTDTSGFKVGVPDGWKYERVGTTVCFWDPGNIRILSIDSGRNPQGDPVKACQTEAKRLVEAGALPGYDQIAIARAPLAIKAADWEYRYDGADDVRMHANTRWFASGGKAFALGWMTRDFEWDQNKATVNLVQSSFRVVTSG